MKIRAVDMDWPPIIATAASIVALLGATSAVARVVRARLQKRSLETSFRSALDLELQVAAVACELQKLLLNGVEWCGMSFFPPPLASRLQILDDAQNKLGELVARTRSLDSSGGVERLRGDVEAFARDVRGATAKYRQGATGCYVAGDGRLSGLSVAGRMLSPLLEKSASPSDSYQELAVRESREELVRSLAWRFKDDDLARTYSSPLPILEYEFEISNFAEQ